MVLAHKTSKLNFDRRNGEAQFEKNTVLNLHMTKKAYSHILNESTNGHKHHFPGQRYILLVKYPSLLLSKLNI